MEGMNRKPRGDKVKEYIGLLGTERVSITTIAVIMGVSYYTAKGMLQYISEHYNCVHREYDGMEFKYYIEKDVARGLLKDD